MNILYVFVFVCIKKKKFFDVVRFEDYIYCIYVIFIDFILKLFFLSIRYFFVYNICNF